MARSDFDKQELAKRLSEAVRAAGGPATVSALTDIPLRTLGNYMSGASEPKASAVLAIAKVSGLTMQWIAEGISEVPAGNGSSRVAYPQPEFAYLPRFEVRASAGQGLVAVSEHVAETLAFRRDWLSRLGVNPQSAGLVTAEGDSMAPTIPNGAIMLVDVSIQDVRNGLIYVMVRDGEVLVKRVQVKADRSVVLISDNDRYERETISREQLADFHIAGRVVWVGHGV